MLLAYLDETHGGVAGRGNYYVVAAVIEPEQSMLLTQELDDLVRSTARKFNVSAQAELHGHELMKGSDDWTPMRLELRARISLYRDCLSVIADRIDGFYVRGVNRERLLRRYSQASFDPHVVATKFVLEELEKHCTPQDQLALCIADEHGQHAAVRDEMRRMRHGVGWGYKQVRLDHILDTCHFVPSHHSRMVQATDMIAYMYRRQRDHVETDPRAQAARDLMWGEIKHRLIREHVWHP